MKFGLFKTTSQKYVAMLGAFTTIQNQRKSEQILGGKQAVFCKKRLFIDHIFSHNDCHEAFPIYQKTDKLAYLKMPTSAINK